MPLFKVIDVNAFTKIWVWEIKESFQELIEGIELQENSLNRLLVMKSQIHQRAFLSVRKLLQQAGYTDFDLFYDSFGKPHLEDDTHISITHSHHFSAIITSNQPVGIDLELQREKIVRIADKFTDMEGSFLQAASKEVLIRKLTLIWGVKESIFKIRSEKGISFKEHIVVSPFALSEKQGKAQLYFDGVISNFMLYFEEFSSCNEDDLEQNFSLVYVFG